MHQSSASKLVTFLAFLLLALGYLSVASPVAPDNTAAEVGSVARGLESNEIVRRQSFNVDGTVYAPFGGSQGQVNMPICITNRFDGAMCTVGYVSGPDWGASLLWLFDHNCVQIGFNPDVPWSLLTAQPQGFGFASQLPYYTDVQIVGDPSGSKALDFAVGVWYGSSGFTAPIRNPDYSYWASQTSIDGFFSFAGPFKCGA